MEIPPKKLNKLGSVAYMIDKNIFNFRSSISQFRLNIITRCNHARQLSGWHELPHIISSILQTLSLHLHYEVTYGLPCSILEYEYDTNNSTLLRITDDQASAWTAQCSRIPHFMYQFVIWLSEKTHCGFYIERNLTLGVWVGLPANDRLTTDKWPGWIKC